MSEYRKVWRDRNGEDWFERRNAVVCGLAKEMKIVPADAVVIEWDEVPAVDPEVPGFRGYVGVSGEGSAATDPVALLTYEQHMAAARAQIALALYAQAHPPVDEAVVEALAASIRDIRGDGTIGSDGIARRLIEQGWSKSQVSAIEAAARIARGGAS